MDKILYTATGFIYMANCTYTTTTTTKQRKATATTIIETQLLSVGSARMNKPNEKRFKYKFI